MKGNMIKKFFAILSATLMLATTAACSNNSGDLSNSNIPSATDTNSDSTPEQSGSDSAIALQAPMHLSFDEENFILSWEAVDNAVCYLIDHNGEILEVYGEETYLIPTDGENTFKVQAIGDGENYTDSEWSAELCYQAPAQVSVYEKVNAKLAEAATAEGLVLEKVLGIIEVDLESDNYHILFQTICSKKDVSAYYDMSFYHENPVSVYEILNTFELATFHRKLKKDIVEYKSAESIVDSGLYVGTMEDFKNRGYEISAIQTAVQEGQKAGSRFTFYVVGTFKAYTEYDVQYFTVKYAVTILQPSVDMLNNYEIFIYAAELREITEISCLIHTEYETLEYIQGWAKENDPNYKANEE